MLDWLIRGAQVLDGTGADAFPADVGIKDGAIAAVGRLTDADAAHVLDAQGRTLTPGFLDIHRHTDAALFRPNFGRAELAQGLTTLVGGNCGMSLAPLAGEHAPAVRSYLAPITGAFGGELCFASLADYFAAAERTPQIVNNAMLAGMGTLRALVAGFDDAPLTDGQYRELHRLVERSLADGAVGVSLGLGYAPECFYTTEGLIRALEPLRGGRLPVTVHMRQEGDGVVDALREMLTVARELRCPVEISHLKGIGRRNWGRAVPEMLRLLENARAEGLDVACDVYPYSAGSTQLIHVLPPEFQKGGLDALTAALRDPTARAAMRGRMETGSDFENITHLVGFENVVPISLHTEEYKPFEGKSLAEIADMLGKDPYDALFDLLAAERCEAGMIDFIAAEEDIEAILRAPFSVPISDATYPVEGLCHPRVYGSAARFLAHYVRERGILTLPQAVHKLTMQSADRLGLSRKGRIAVGADADLCLFSPESIRENGAYTAPRQLASGMDAVFVAGVPEIMDGQFTGETQGRVLRAH